MSEYVDEPEPRESDGPDIADLVCEDIQARKQIGIKTYGMPLRANNGRRALRDAYAEILDMAHYVKQEMEEREALADVIAVRAKNASEAARKMRDGTCARANTEGVVFGLSIAEAMLRGEFK